MARGSQELVGGRYTHFGPRGLDQKFGAAQSRVGPDTYLEYIFDYNDVPQPGANELILSIPQYAHILEASVYALEGANAAATLSVGLSDVDGANTIALASAAAGDLVNKGDAVVGSGAGVGDTIPALKQVDVDTTATEGVFKVVIKYRSLEEDASGVKSY